MADYKSKIDQNKLYLTDSTLKAKYSMGQFHYMRIHEILKNINDFGFEVGAKNYGAMSKFLSAMHQLFITIQPTILESKALEIEELFNKCDEMILEYEKTGRMHKELSKSLFKIESDLFLAMDKNGLGIIKEKELTSNQRIDEAFRSDD